MKNLWHPNIVQYLGAEREEGSLTIFLELVPGGSLATMLAKFGRFKEPIVRGYVREILQGLVYLHSQQILHRDIKGSNILVPPRPAPRHARAASPLARAAELLGSRPPRTLRWTTTECASCRTSDAPSCCARRRPRPRPPPSAAPRSSWPRRSSRTSAAVSPRPRAPAPAARALGDVSGGAGGVTGARGAARGGLQGTRRRRTCGAWGAPWWRCASGPLGARGRCTPPLLPFPLLLPLPYPPCRGPVRAAPALPG
jgi:serine/threonine protein kinase